jgi:malonyl-CoA O-methyltransferase
VSRNVDFVLPERRAARRAFDRAAATFASASVVHDEARRRLLERLDYLRVAPATVVDLGAATGRSAAALATRFPAARVLAVDTSIEMLRAAHASAPAVLADAQRLPLIHASTDLLFANLCLPWCRPDRVLAEAARVLSDGGLFMFSTLGPDTLAQVRRAWASVDDAVHVHALFDMHDLGDLAVAAGLAEPVLDVDRLEITYGDLTTLIADLRACGAVNVAAGRRRTLTGRTRWAGFESALLAGRENGRFRVTVELILGQAFGRGPPRPRAARSPSETSVPVAEVGRPRRR